MICPKCKREMLDGETVCPSCGAAAGPAPHQAGEKDSHGGWLAELLGLLLAVGGVWWICSTFWDIKLGGKSIVFWVAVPLYMCFNKRADVSRWIVVAVLVGIFWWANPNEDAHLAKVDEHSGFFSLFQPFERHGYLLFSTGELGGKTCTIGILGKVFWVGGE